MKIDIPITMTRKSLLLYTGRTAANFISMITWTETIKILGANDSMAIGYITPIWLVIFAMLVCGEALTIRSVVAIILNTTGVAFIIHAKFEHVTIYGR